MRHAQIERLRTLKKRIHAAWQGQISVTEADTVLADVAELVDILLMEVEDHDTTGSEPWARSSQH